MLWLALHVPDLALQVFAPSPETTPFAVTGSGRRPTLLAVNPAAQVRGVLPGMTPGAAQVLAPELRLRPRDPRREAEALRGLALWALQFTPELSLAPPQAVLLEIGGCLKLFGGLERLLHKVGDGLTELGLAAVPAVAPTATGAHMLARAGLELRVQDDATLRRCLGALPLDCLAQPDDTLTGLARLGLKTLGDCLALPRAGLARRFGPGLLDELDRALGDAPDPRPPFTPPRIFATDMELAAAVNDVDALSFGVKRLLAQLCGWLDARNAGVRRLTLTLRHERHPPAAIGLSLTTPQRDAAHLLAVLRERLARQDLRAGVTGLQLHADDTAQLMPLNFSLFGERDHLRADCLNLVERLQARLGADAVTGLDLYPEHRPELAWRETPPGSDMHARPFPPRPLWLLSRPRPLAERHGAPWLDGAMTLLTDAERIESGWWDDTPVRRDYHQARTTNGSRCWLYREAGTPARWFLHGWFA